LPPFSIHFHSKPVCQLANTCKPKVVACVGELRLGIAQANDQPLSASRLIFHPISK